MIPLLVYHGKSNWNYNKDIRKMIPDFQILPEYLKQMLPVLRHDFVNITAYSEDDIKEYEPLTRIVLRSFKYIFGDDKDLIEAFLLSIEEIESLVTEEKLNYYVDTVLIYYSAVNKNLTEEDIIKKIHELEGKGEKIMTILQEREQKGIEEGMELGIEQGIEQGELKRARESAIELLKMEIDIKKIAIVTKLSTREVEEIKKSMLN